MKSSIKNLNMNAILKFFLLCIALNTLITCENILEIPDPKGEIIQNQVFENESTAEAAVLSLYAKLRSNSFSSGSINGLSVLMGLYADELDYHSLPGSAMDDFYRHQILASNEMVDLLWKDAYNLIYMCNAALEGIHDSSNISDDLKLRLEGEILFIRAMTYFYLINLFGDVPYVVSTDYTINQDLGRAPVSEIYQSIILDLEIAKNLLPDTYLETERTRATTYAASALLSRIYLFQSNWQKAEDESSVVIEQSSLFFLESDLNNEFKKESHSAILQLKPQSEGNNTAEANSFIFFEGPPPLVALNSSFVDSFENSDLRRQAWVKEIIGNETIWYAPYKYKENGNTGTSVEYSILFRLSELYLIRSESRLNLGNYIQANEDINTIRLRAGLNSVSLNTHSELSDEILKQRKFELFTEHGFRWFDLRRLNLAGDVLSPIKSGWRQTDTLLPLPENELILNPNLYPQNPGY